MTEGEISLTCMNQVEGFNGLYRACGCNIFEIIMIDGNTIKIKCARCGDAKTFKVVECLDE